MSDCRPIKPLRLTAVLMLSLGAACLLAADHLSPLALLFGPVCLVGGLHCFRRSTKLSEELLFDVAVRAVGLVREDQRFNSMKPLLIAHRVIREGLPRYECLCMDRAGHWMVYRFALLARRPADVQIEPISDTSARRWLQATPALYAKWFAEAG